MDDIQRKLAIIDQELTGARDFHRRIISTAPLLFAAVGLITGIVLQNSLGLSVWAWVVLLGVCAAATAAYLVSRISYFAGKTSRPYVMAYAALVCFLCLGGIRLANYYQAEANDIRNLMGAGKELEMDSRLRGNDTRDERVLATVRGQILTEPYVYKQRWEFARFTHTDPASSFYLKVTEAEAVDGWQQVSGTVRVQVAQPVLDLQAGDYVQIYCWLDRFEPAGNPGQFDTAKYLARKNVFVAAYVQSREAIEVRKSSGGGIFTKIKRKLRRTAMQALVGNLSPEEASRGLLEALLLGYRGNIDSDTYRAFRRTGLLHFISLSGLHVGILIGIVWWLCRVAGLLKRGRAAVCIIAICLFLLIVPPRAPTLRAAIICFVFCVSFFFRRYSNPLNTLSLAAIILLLIRPTNLFEAGWQLSFASVLGILLFTDRIENFFRERTNGQLWNISFEDPSLLRRLAKRLGKMVITLFSVGLAAWLGGAGILLYHFYSINPLTSIWTVLVFPLVGAILTLGFLKMILFFLLPTLGAVLGVIVTGLSEALIWAVKLIAQVDISQILIGRVPLWAIIFYYAFVLFAGFAYLRRPAIKKVVCAAALVLIISLLGVTKWQRTYRNDLIVTCLDVGHGQAIFAQLPGKTNVLFDAGSLYKNDVGRRIVAPFLDYSGINKIDAIAISHGSVDHINGIPEVVQDRNVGAVYAGCAFLSGPGQAETVRFLTEWLDRKGLKIQAIGQELNLSESAEVKAIWPSEQACEDERLSDNDKSAVWLIEFAGARILLCSDIENFAQQQLLRLFPNLKCEAVVVPHHGSARTLEADFLRRLGADILIYSCSQRQYQACKRVSPEDKRESFYTAQDGAITVHIDKKGRMTCSSYRGTQAKGYL
jgi:competence protein ComEC